MSDSSPHPADRPYGPFELVVVRRGTDATLYTIRFADREETEFDRFLSAEKIVRNHFFEALVSRLRLSVDRYGFRPEFFEHGKGYDDGVLGYLRTWEGKIPPPLTLRLYVARFSESVMIVGSGCVKNRGDRLEHSPDCAQPFYRLRNAYRRIMVSMELNEIILEPNDTEFFGRTQFENTR